jgi:hypothetical protein
MKSESKRAAKFSTSSMRFLLPLCGNDWWRYHPACGPLVSFIDFFQRVFPIRKLFKGIFAMIAFQKTLSVGKGTKVCTE